LGDENLANSLFDPVFYGAQASTKDHVLEHFLTGGWRDFDPHPLFSSSYYLARNPDVAAANVNPLLHWLDDGWRERRDPHPLFSSSYYLARNPDVAAANVNPLLHWLDDGWREKRAFHELFDIEFYLAQLDDDTKTDVLLHFLSGGWREFDPHPLFSSSYYLARNPVVAAAIRSPFEHFLTVGGAQKFEHHPLFDPTSRYCPAGESEIPVINFLRAGGLVDTSRHFNLEWYLSQSADARLSTEPPVVHWIKFGSKRGIPPTSHPFAESLSDLLAKDPISGILLADIHIPRANSYGEPRVVPFELDSNKCHPGQTRQVHNVIVSGDVQGVITREGWLIGSPDSRAISVRNQAGHTVIRGSRGLTAGIFSLPKTEEAIIIATPEHGETYWFLSALSQIRRFTASHPGTPVLTSYQGVRDHLKELSQHVIRQNPLVFVPSGILREVGDALVLTLQEYGQELEDSQDKAITSSSNIVLIDPEDDLTSFNVSDLGEQLTTRELILVDLRWPADVVLALISSAAVVYASRALPIAICFASTDAEIRWCTNTLDIESINAKSRHQIDILLKTMGSRGDLSALNSLTIRSAMGGP
jgi:hypothetical protein